MVKIIAGKYKSIELLREKLISILHVKIKYYNLLPNQFMRIISIIVELN